MRGVYCAQAEIASLAAAKTVLLGQTSANICLEILEVRLSNGNVSALEQLLIGLYLVTTVGSAAGSSGVNIQKNENGDASTVVTWLSDLTTEPTTYNAAPIDYQGVSNLSGYEYVPLPEDRKIISPSTYFGLRLRNTPSSAFKAECMIKYREIGG